MVDVLDLQSKYDALLTERAGWDVDYRILAKNLYPRQFRSVETGDQTNKGGLRSDIIKNTGMLALRDLAAGMHGGMTSPVRPWFHLSLQDEDMAKNKRVRSWLDECQNRMRTVFHRSNFYNAIHSQYAVLGCFGTGFMFALADPQTVVRFLNLNMGEFCLDLDEVFRVDTVFRSVDMTVRQIVRRFGYDKSPDVIKRLFDTPTKAQVDRFKVVHAVYPRNDRNPSKLDGKNKPYSSIYYLSARDGGSIKGGLQYPRLLSESGFDTFPGFGPRWDVIGSDTYGVSAGMYALGDVLQLQQMERSKLKALHKEVDPPMARPSDMKGLSLMPGADNAYDVGGSGGNQPIYPLLQIRPQIQNTVIAIQEVQKDIREAMYSDLFKMLVNSDRREITAREVAAKEEEKLILLGPVLERLHDELFNPLINRTWDLMVEQDMFSAAPEEIQGSDIKVEFVSLLAQAQKMVATSAVDQYMAFVGTYAPIIPELADTVDADQMADGYAGYLGLETDMLRAQEDRDKGRQARAQMIQQQQQAEQMAAAQSGAQTAKTMAETPVESEEPNALDAILGGLAGGGR